MNLIPWVFFSILLFTLTSSSLSYRLLSTKAIYQAHKGLMDALAGAQDTLEENAFKKQLVKKPSSSSGQSSDETSFAEEIPPEFIKPIEKKPSKAKASPRFKISCNSKFNLARFFEEDTPLMNETLIQALDLLYGKISFFTKSPKHLVQALRIASKDIPLKELDLKKLQFKDPKLAEIWYQIVKGTAAYDLEKGEGWPPLSHFFLINLDKNRGALCHSKAHPIFLEAALGPETTDMILSTELAEKKILTKTAFNSLLDEQSLGERKALFSNQTLSDSTTLAHYKDKESGITILLEQL